MVHPDDGVAFGTAGRGDGQRSRALIEGDERTGGIEAEAGDLDPGAARGLRRLADGRGRRRPDVDGGMLDNLAGLSEYRNRPARAGKQLAPLVEYARTHAGRADVDADIGFIHSRPLLPSAIVGRRPGDSKPTQARAISGIGEAADDCRSCRRHAIAGVSTHRKVA